MNFDEIIDRRGTHCSKWDTMEKIYGVPAETGISMWVADMDFRPPACVQSALEDMTAHGIYGYFGDDGAYLDAIQWWMANRHGWQVERDWIFSTHGLVNGTGMCIDTFTKPGDGVVLMTPVYHAFARTIKAAGRQVVECQLAVEDGRYKPDFAAWDAQMTGGERMLILCSPHNPGGRVWTREELRGVADFCIRHDLILVSDEIHHDLVFGGKKHTVMPLAAPEIVDRLVMMTATTKTFNIAGAHIGNVIIPDPALRAAFGARMMALGISANSFRPRDGDGGLFADGRCLAGRAGGLYRRKPPPVRRRRQRDPRHQVDAAGGDLPGLGRLRGHRHDRAGIHRPRPEGSADRREPWPDFRRGGRDVPAVQPGHTARPRRAGGGADAKGVRRPAMKSLATAFRLLVLLIALGLGALAVYSYRYPAPPTQSLPPLTGTIDRIVIEKSARKLTVYRGGVALRDYKVALGFGPVGHKEREGDGRTPEGTYRIDRRNGESAYHLSLGLDYPRPRRHRAGAGGGRVTGRRHLHPRPTQRLLRDGHAAP